MTEEQAKEKWCPFSNSPGSFLTGAISINLTGRVGEILHTSKCLGSACMAWHWEKKPNQDWKPEPGGMMSYPPRDKRFDEPMYIDDETEGHCGLAGR